MPTNTPPSEPSQESLFGNFEIERDAAGNPVLLGRGTFGRTYRARHRYLEIIVALKIISERFARVPTARERFLTEARAAAKLSHPHIARLYDFGEKQSVLFYAMEFCAGGDLGDYVRRHGPLTSAQLLEVAKQLGEALQCAHAAGLIHRDIKPSNVMLAGDEHALVTKLIDFGLVDVHGTTKPARGDDASTDDARMLGTPLFASPEQLREETVDARADLFSLGMTLWYLALGGPPESGSSSEITSSRLSTDSYGPWLPQGMPAPLKSALQRLVEKNPRNRFASAAEFLQALSHEGTVSSASDVAVSVSVEKTGAAEPQAKPLAIETINAPLDSQWKTGNRQSESLTGITYAAVSADDAQQQVWLHVLDDRLAESSDLLWRLQVNAGKVLSLRLPGLLSPHVLRAYSDFTALVMEKPDCTSLLSAIPAQSTGVISELYPALEKIAETSDALSTVYLPGPNLQASNIWLQAPVVDLQSAQPKLFPSFLFARDAPQVSAEPSPTDLGSTVTSEMLTSLESADDVRVQFARLIYRLCAGRNCPAAASLASQAYVAVPNLSEQANRKLALVIAGTFEYATCRALLRDLRRSEGSTATASLGARSRLSASRRPTTQPSLGGPVLAESPLTRTPSGTATVAPPPISFREPVAPRRAAPRRPSALVLAGALLAGMVAIFAAYRVLQKPSVVRPTEARTGTFTAETKLRLNSSGIPRHVTFSIEGRRLTAEHDGSDLALALTGIAKKFPLEVAVEAKGFKKSAITIKDEADLLSAHPISLFRSTGRIMFVGPAADYTHASVSMKSLLPDEKDLDEIRMERADRGTEIRPGGRNTIEVATGVYAINLRGDNGRTVRPRFLPEKYEIKADETVTVSVPPTFVGHYKGSVKESGDATKQFELEITIEDGLSNGQLTEHRNSSARSGSWTDGNVAADGIYRAQLHFDNAQEAGGGNVSLALRCLDERKIALQPDAAPSGRDRQTDTLPSYSATGNLERVEADQQQ
jgi:serine/threonine protein kinase